MGRYVVTVERRETFVVEVEAEDHAAAEEMARSNVEEGLYAEPDATDVTSTATSG